MGRWVRYAGCLAQVVKKDGEISIMECTGWIAEELGRVGANADCRFPAARLCLRPGMQLIELHEYLNALYAKTGCHDHAPLRYSLARFHGLMERYPRFLQL